MIFQANGNQKKVGEAILTPNKIDFKLHMDKREKEDHYIMIKGSNHQENVTSIHIYAPNTRALKYKRQILIELKGKINSNRIIVEDFNKPFSTMD